MLRLGDATPMVAQMSKFKDPIIDVNGFPADVVLPITKMSQEDTSSFYLE
jgi:hypothetical protein